MTKRETCAHATPFDHQNRASVCNYPLPPCYQQERLVVMDECCDYCPPECWKEKEPTDGN